jgi:hypothetical protein
MINDWKHVWENDRRHHRLISLMASMFETSLESSKKTEKSWSLEFLKYPTSIDGNHTDQVKSISFVDTNLLETSRLDMNAKYGQISRQKISMQDLKNFPIENHNSLDQHRKINSIKCDMVISCLGFKPETNFGLPTDHRGRFRLDQNGKHHIIGRPMYYAAGWALTGSTGKLADTFRNANEIANFVVEEIDVKPRDILPKFLFSKEHIFPDSIS